VRTVSSRSRVTLLVAAVLSASCVTGDYDKVRTFQAPPAGSYDDLVIGVTDVGQAMDALGAPVQVIEIGRGLALAWGWLETTEWNVAAAIPLGDANGRLSFTDTDEKVPGVVLFFDDAWRLTAKRRGFLAELLPESRPPRDVDDDLTDPEPGS
jgi:hypothetical protein